jgi:hypothetical protein
MQLRNTSQLWLKLLLLGGMVLNPFGMLALTVEFAEPTYTVRPGDTVDLVVRLDQAVPEGLGGYALKMNFPTGLLAIDAITVTPQLDFDLFEPGAELDAGLDYASVAGFVEFGQSAYAGTEFVTITVTVSKAAPEGPVVLKLDPLLDSAVNFVDGLGNSLDGSLILGTATLNVLPPWPVEFLDDFRVDVESGSPVIRFTGTPGRPYRIQSSSGLTGQSWVTLGEVVAPQDGLVEVPDSLPASGRFYRVIEP